MPMPGRQANSGDYRYGFNGMESESELTQYATEFRQYDPRIARWTSLDPLMAKYPFQSPFLAFNGSPVFYSDPTGLEGEDPEKVAPSEYHGAAGGGVVELPSNTTVNHFKTDNPKLKDSEIRSNAKAGEVESFTVGGTTYTAGFGKESGEFKGYFDGSGNSYGVSVPVQKAGIDGGAMTVYVLILRQSSISIPVVGPLGLIGVMSGLMSQDSRANSPEFISYNIPYNGPYPIPMVMADENLMDPPVAIYYHYTDLNGIAGISGAQAIYPNHQGKVYLTQTAFSPQDAEMKLFLSQKTHIGKGDYVAVFYVTASQQSMISKDPSAIYEYIYKGGGSLRIRGQLLYCGPNLVQ